MALVVSFEKPPRGFEFAVIPNAGEDVQNFALGSASVAHAVRCEKWKTQRFGETHRRLVAALFDRITVPLHFDIDVLFPEESLQLLNVLARFAVTLARKRSGQQAFLTAFEIHQPLG